MKIGVDIDGVVADFVSAYSELINKTAGLNLQPQSDTYPTEWYYERAAGLTKKDENTVWNHIRTTGFWGTLHALPGAVDALTRLWKLEREHDIYFITSRPGTRAKWLTQQWLSWHGFANATVLLANDKGSIAKGLELDVMIEDKPENLEAVLLNGNRGKTQGYMIDRPYNRKWQKENQNAVRFSDMFEMVAYPVIVVKNLNEALDLMFEPLALKEAA